MSDLPPRLSTIVLNWNRADLLERTLESYLDTTDVTFELFVIDNGSVDESPSVIQRFASKVPQLQAILLPENLGGEALDIGFQRGAGDLLHLSENDVEYLPGWFEAADELFDLFPQLGQLSLFGPVPTDDEIWSSRSSGLKQVDARFLYESAQDNVGTTSVIRRAVRDSGVHIQTLHEAEGSYLFPADLQLSRDVRAAGYTVAWAPRYLVRNLGHTAEEFESRDAYYREGYRSKAIGVTGWERRIAAWKATDRPRRASFLPLEGPLMAEKTDPHEGCAEPQLWSMVDGWTAEVEVLEFLYALVRLTKPARVVETGTWRGFSASSVGAALRDNGRGHLVTLEVDAGVAKDARDRIARAGLERWVDVRAQPSLVFEPEGPIGMLILDSELDLRIKELERFRPYLATGSVVVFHDTSTTHRVVRLAVERLSLEGELRPLFLDCPRGLVICTYVGRRRPIVRALRRIVGRLLQSVRSPL